MFFRETRSQNGIVPVDLRKARAALAASRYQKSEGRQPILSGECVAFFAFSLLRNPLPAGELAR